MPFAWAAGAAAVAGIAGSVISSNAAKDAAKTQANAANKGVQAQTDMFNKIQANLDPYMKLGQSALGPLGNLLGLNGGNSASMLDQLKQYPGYQFAYDQGLRGVTANNATRGLALSGAQVKGAEDYGQGMASNLFNQYFQQLQQTAGIGANAAAGVGQAGVQTGQGIANSLLAQGQANASGTVGSANAINQGIGSVFNNALEGYKLYQDANPATTTTFDTSFMSDPDTKTDIRPANDDNLLESIRRMPTYHYRYKPDAGDGGAESRVGPMADDFARTRGGNGKVIPMPQMIGTMHGAIRSLADQVEELKRAHG
jgi:hypothetical protein